MKKSSLLITLFCATVLHSAMAAPNPVCDHEPGMTTCHHGTIEAVNSIGMVTLKGTTVQHDVTVLGDLDSNNANLNALKIRGNLDIASSTVSHTMQILGNVRGIGLTVDGETNIIGDFEGSSFTANSPVNIKGLLSCKDCVFAANTALFGEINVTNSEFKSPLEISAKNASFIHSKLQDITVKTIQNSEAQTIELKDDSLVHDIRFEGQKGTVILTGNSKVTGAVHNGNIITKL